MLGCKSNSVNHFNSKFSLEICHLEKIYNFCLGDDGYLQTPGILGDCFCCTMMWWGSRIASSGLRLGLPPQDCDWDCLLRIAITSRIASSGLGLVPPRIKVFFYDKGDFLQLLDTKVLDQGSTPLFTFAPRRKFG